jgi:hypothetical protein
MRILLQNVQTKLYFCLLGTWTANPHAAHNFRHSEQALEYVHKQGLTDVQLVVKFEDPQWDEIVPLPVLVATLTQRLAGV